MNEPEKWWRAPTVRRADGTMNLDVVYQYYLKHPKFLHWKSLSNVIGLDSVKSLGGTLERIIAADVSNKLSINLSIEQRWYLFLLLNSEFTNETDKALDIYLKNNELSIAIQASIHANEYVLDEIDISESTKYTHIKIEELFSYALENHKVVFPGNKIAENLALQLNQYALAETSDDAFRCLLRIAKDYRNGRYFVDREGRQC